MSVIRRMVAFLWGYVHIVLVWLGIGRVTLLDGLDLPEIGHVLSVDQFDRPFLDKMCELTTKIRVHSRTKKGALELQSLFKHMRVMLLFTEASSRTFTSFAAACQNIGASFIDVRDIKTSSVVKGETPLDTIRTYSSYVDAIVMRSPEEGLIEEAALHLDTTKRPIPMINAGSGANEHPTQALLDIYTMERSFKDRGGIDGKTIALVGDLKRGRTVRSLAKLMHHYRDVTLLFVSLPEFRMKQDILDHLDHHGVRYEILDDFDEAVRRADAVYMTRDQHDRNTEKGASVVSIGGHQFLPRHLDLLGPNAIVLHPLPRNKELDPACDKDPRVKIWRQERNGMWMRTLLLICILHALEKRRALEKRNAAKLRLAA